MFTTSNCEERKGGGRQGVSVGHVHKEREKDRINRDPGVCICMRGKRGHLNIANHKTIHEQSSLVSSINVHFCS